MNYHDSERIRGMFEQKGFVRAESFGDADVVLINTCSVREKPERKLFAELARLKAEKKRNPDLIIGVSGCMAPRDGDIIRQRAPYVDLLVGPRSIHRLPDLIEQVRLQRLPVDAIDLFDDPTPVTPTRRTNTVSAWVDVIFGCNYQCTFCAVPSARGGERSRDPQDIFIEIDELRTLGYREITLLGQTVNAYGRDFKYRFEGIGDGRIKSDFAWLLREIDHRAPELRVRFTSPHPQLFTDRLIAAIAESRTVCEHVHLPLQSGDDYVLRRMQRSYTVTKFRSIVDKLRRQIPDIAISTDLIVGFPSESDAAFHRTLDAVREFGFDQAYMFAYSPRRHTEAFEYEDAIPAEVQSARLQELIELVNTQAQRKNRSEIGRSFEVLVEGTSEKNPQRLSGRTRRNKLTVFDGPGELIGKLATVRADKGFLWGYDGTLVESHEP